ncbi:hypothetical protein SRABI84_05341 [Peribacillus simplex]|nr:hypothetical protein SRABI84_05341 [Peribacillus simplex]
MKQVTTLFLKLAVIFIGIPVLALCIFLVPHMANFAAILYPNIAPMKYLVFIVMYGAAVPFYFAPIRLSIFYGTLTRTQRSRNYL